MFIQTKQNKQGNIWYLGKFKRICVDFSIATLQVNSSKEIKKIEQGHKRTMSFP